MTLSEKLRLLSEEESISLLDLSVENMTVLPDSFLAGASLHGLVVTSGELRSVSDRAFRGLFPPLQALGLPSNRLETIPSNSFQFLKDLERLDLSNNGVVRLNGSSFRYLNNLTFLDLSENRISEIAADAFVGLKRLKELNLRKNRVTADAIFALSDLQSVEDIDLSVNALAGPLRNDTLPPLPSLRTLNLANNQFSSIRQGALTGASSLLALSLNHNHIDVLEDHAFRELSSLKTLDLSNNHIVTISGSSLAHLTQLTKLDLSHNFLIALTSDIISPLTSLRVLLLDDNDISIVACEDLTEKSTIERLTLSDNPLNCDCTLADFAVWFNNASRFSADDLKTAVCMTPPNLENALLVEIAPSDLLCEEGDDANDGEVTAHVTEAQIVLRAFNFDGSVVTLLWSIDPVVHSFTCDALFLYEQIATRELLLHSTPLRCNSSQLADPSTLTVRLPTGSLQEYHRYRYCVVLLAGSKYSDEMHLILGCSEAIPLIRTETSVPQPSGQTYIRIAALEANVSYNVLRVSVHLWNDMSISDVKCHVALTVFMMGSLLTQHTLNCSDPEIAITGLPQGHYHVCAKVRTYPTTETKLHCVTVKAEKMRGTSGSLLIVCFVLLSAFLMVGVCLLVRKVIKRSRLRSAANQCFLVANDPDDDDHKQHCRYAKLQTTTVM